ncbi:MAG: preprotein translocase subunit SecG [Pyrinomonadaceae bacterium]|nr:preprotein translocase subunit SecG [Pyrinomonadaceae bacterium]
MLIYTLYGLFILACVVLILSVLLQPGKADAGALFTSSVSSTAFGPRGTQTLLAKITIGAAITFMLVALTLSLGIGERRSVLEGGVPESTASPTPAASPSIAPQGDAAPVAVPPSEGAAPAATTTPAAATTPANSPQTAPAR